MVVIAAVKLVVVEAKLLVVVAPIGAVAENEPTEVLKIITSIPILWPPELTVQLTVVVTLVAIAHQMSSPAQVAELAFDLAARVHVQAPELCDIVPVGLVLLSNSVQARTSWPAVYALLADVTVVLLVARASFVTLRLI